MELFEKPPFVLDRERLYYPKIREILQLLKHFYPLLHPTVNAGGTVSFFQIIVKREDVKNQSSQTRIYLDYSVALSEKQESVSIHQIVYTYDPDNEESWTVSPGSVDETGHLLMQLQQQKDSGIALSSRHYLVENPEQNQEIFILDFADFEACSE